MTLTTQDMNAALARLTEAFPQTFVLEKYRPHRPLKVGIAADIPARCPALTRRELGAALSAYAQREKFILLMETLKSHASPDGAPRAGWLPQRRLIRKG